MRILPFLILLIFCKPVSVSVPNTISGGVEYNELKYLYDFYFHQFQGTLRLKYIVQLEKDIETSLLSNMIPAKNEDEIRKMLHKVRSFIAYAEMSGCLEKDTDGNYKATAKTKEMLCSVILYKLKELDYKQIDLDRPISTVGYDRQQFFSALTNRIEKTVVDSMKKYQRIFPFAKSDLVRICRELNTKTVYETYKPIAGNPDLAPPPYHSYPKKVQKNQHCQQLVSILEKDSRQEQNEKVYTDIHALSNAVNATVTKLNKEIDKLDRLIHGADGGKPATKKDHLLFFKVANITDLENENVINAYDKYTSLLVESARDGLLPILLVYYPGKFHLNPKGGWWGLQQVKYTPLEYALSRKVEESIADLNAQLVKKWLSLLETKGKTKKDKAIYELLVNNEISVSQLIMQDPGYGVSVTSLLTQYQDDHRAPKWLQLFKSWTYRMDMIFIALTIASAIISGGAAIPLVAAISVSINFFWVGVTTTETLLARKRYATMERALLSGTSVQVRRGMKLLREFHTKRHNAIVSGTVGVPLSIPSLKMAINSVYGLKTVPIDLTAALSSDLDNLSHTKHNDLDLLGRFDGKSDTELHKGY